MIIAAHQTMMAPPALPYDAEVEYLESTGTQYVDTGVTMDSSSVFDGEVAATASGTQFVFGVYENQTKKTFAIAAASSGKWIYDRGEADRSRIVSSASVSVGAKTSIRATANTLTVDGASNTGTQVSFSGQTRTALLFAWDRTAFDGTTGFGKCRVYSCRLYDANGTLVRSFVPVRVGSVGYLFDRVSGQLFGNAGTGDFVLGPDTFATGVLPTRMMVGGVRKKLPYDAEVEYLESTGTQYIDTGVLLGQSGKVVEYRVGFAYTSLPSSTARYSVCGSYGSDGTRNGWLTSRLATSEYVSLAIGNGTKATTIPVGTQRVDCSVIIDAPNSRVSATSSGASVLNVSFSGGFPANNNYLFARSGDNGAVAENMLGRIYYYEQYVDGVLVRDYIPVRIGTVGYLYDRVSGTLYGNAGTGNFTVGSDKN